MGGTFWLSGVYRFLKTMEKSGLVVSSWDTPGRGHAKRLYEITDAGESCLARWAETLEEYLAAVKSLLETTRAAAARKRGRQACTSKQGRRRPGAG